MLTLYSKTSETTNGLVCLVMLGKTQLIKSIWGFLKFDLIASKP